MKWLSVCVMALVCVTVAPVQLRCAACKDEYNNTLGFARFFIIEDYRIEIYYKTHDTFIFTLNCHGFSALDSLQLPTFDSLLRVNTVVFESCPPPKTSNFSKVLARMNVILERTSQSNETDLRLVNLPSHPKLGGKHFAGLEHLTSLTIDNEVKSVHPMPENSFLEPLRNLTKLELKRIRIPFSEFPHKISSMSCQKTQNHNRSSVFDACSYRVTAPRPETPTRQQQRRRRRSTRQRQPQPSLLYQLFKKILRIPLAQTVGYNSTRR